MKHGDKTKANDKILNRSQGRGFKVQRTKYILLGMCSGSKANLVLEI